MESVAVHGGAERRCINGPRCYHVVHLSQDEPARIPLASKRAATGARLERNLSSPNDSLIESDDYTSDEVPGLVCFAHSGAPEPVDFLLGKAVPLGYVTNFHGAGGFGKSVLAMLVSLSVSGYQKECLGLVIRKCGGVLYLDRELDARGQHPRVGELCKGLGIPVPEGLHYLSALGLDTTTAFERAHRACKKLGITLLVIDSWGPFMDGDMESAKDVIRFYNNHLKPLVDQEAPLSPDAHSPDPIRSADRGRGEFTKRRACEDITRVGCCLCN